jgi:hypothetical protein
MAAAKKAAGAAAAAQGAWGNPYVQRFIEDAELRDNVRTAYDSARSAYGRLNNGKGPAKALLDDKKLHRDLQAAADSLREASDSLRGKKARKRGGLGKLLLLSLVGGVAALALSEGLRNKVLDALFGAEEEFDYTSTTAPATPAPAPTDASATTSASSNGS